MADLSPHALVIHGASPFRLRVDELGYIRTEPEGLLGEEPIQPVGSEVIRGPLRMRIGADGTIEPPPERIVGCGYFAAEIKLGYTFWNVMSRPTSFDSIAADMSSAGPGV